MNPVETIVPVPPGTIVTIIQERTIDRFGPTQPAITQTSNSTSTSSIVIIAVSVVSVVIILAIIAIICVKRQRKRKDIVYRPSIYNPSTALKNTQAMQSIPGQSEDSNALAPSTTQIPYNNQEVYTRNPYEYASNVSLPQVGSVFYQPEAEAGYQGNNVYYYVNPDFQPYVPEQNNYQGEFHYSEERPYQQEENVEYVEEQNYGHPK